MKKLFAIYLHTMMRLAEKSSLVRRALRSGNSLLVRYLIRQHKKGGIAAWQSFWVPAFREYGNHRSSYLINKMNIDISDAQSVGSYHDYEDPILGVEGHWDNDSEGNAIRVETTCVVCDDLMRMTSDEKCRSDFCRHIVTAMEQGTGQAINEKYNVGIIALLTEGDESCKFLHTIK
ncbi:hypothetical protein [Vibrio sp. HN007]|uniref:hypothetical protein n=1 Tax=Vibrio iocasae TaxID=3098914 RepID=UPI0035D516EA